VGQDGDRREILGYILVEEWSQRSISVAGTFDEAFPFSWQHTLDTRELCRRGDHACTRRLIVRRTLICHLGRSHESPHVRLLPPATVHAVYTPVASFSTGGHFYHYSCMHLTELARYIDAEVGDISTNQALNHALETLRRMVIAVPYLSPRIREWYTSVPYRTIADSPHQTCRPGHCSVFVRWQ
jgi:hypothetical protein